MLFPWVGLEKFGKAVWKSRTNSEGSRSGGRGMFFGKRSFLRVLSTHLLKEEAVIGCGEG